MKKTFIAQILFVCLLLVAGNTFAASGVSINAATGCAPDNKDFIVIIDVAGIGSGGPQLYTDRCIGVANNITSGQIITLPQATSSMPNVYPTHFAFHPIGTSPGNFIELYAWVDCGGKMFFADITPWGANWQITPIVGSNFQVVEVQLSIPGSSVLVRLIEKPGGAVQVIMTSTEGLYCNDTPYPNNCYGPTRDRSDDDATGIVTTSNTLQVAPNPFTTSFESILTLQQDGEVNVAMYDLMGKEVGTESFTGKAGANQFTINTEDLPSGVYMLAVQTGDERLVRKVVKK